MFYIPDLNTHDYGLFSQIKTLLRSSFYGTFENAKHIVTSQVKKYQLKILHRINRFWFPKETMLKEIKLI